MERFEVGKTYSCHSACDHDCVWTFTVMARTPQTITVTDGKQRKTLRIIRQISEYRKAESVYPLGRYSMAPILSASR